MKRILFFMTVLVLIISCKDMATKNTDSANTTDSSQTTNIQSNSDILLIEGDDVWVRSVPTTGDVIMKLHNGSACKVLEKGRKETINGNPDFWYKIEFEGKEGWVFGSQTNLKSQQIQEIAPDILTENDFLTNFIMKVKQKDISNLNDYFIDNSVYQIYNPGAMSFVTKVNYKDFLNSEIFKVDFSTFDKIITSDDLPTFDMVDYEWSQSGYFLTSSEPNRLTDFTQYAPEYYDEATLNEIKETEKIITHQLLIAFDDGVIFYIGQVNNQWKIIAVDISTNDA